MKKIFAQKNKTIGIDIGEGTTKIVQVSRHGDSVSLDAYTHFDGKFTNNRQRYGEALHNALNKPTYGSFSATKTHVSLPMTMCNELLVRAEEKDVYQKLTEQEAVSDNVSWYYYPLSNNHLVHAVIVLPQTTEHSLKQMLGDNDLELDVVRPYHLTYDHYLSLALPSTLLVDIGYSSTKAIIPLSDSLLVHHIDIGSQDITKYLMQQLNISTQQAHHLQQRSGIAETELGYRLRAVLEEPLAALLQNLQDILDSYYDDHKPSEIKLILLGSLAAMPGLNEYLKKNIGVTTESIKPWQETSTYPLKPMPRKRWPQYAHAINLAISH